MARPPLDAGGAGLPARRVGHRGPEPGRPAGHRARAGGDGAARHLPVSGRGRGAGRPGAARLGGDGDPGLRRMVAGVLRADHAPTPTDIREAAARLRPVAVATPLERSPRLSREHGCDLQIKREDLQVTRSYKIRGAYNLIEHLPDLIRGRGVVCSSAGNHAPGVPHSCARLGVPAFVFLPRSTPRQKLARIREIGGELARVELAGDSYDEAAQSAIAFADAKGLPVVPPFDHPDIIAGQGTVGLEMVDGAAEPPEVLVVPVGGGGLAAGIAAYV